MLSIENQYARLTGSHLSSNATKKLTEKDIRGQFRKNYIKPALQQNWIAMTQPESPQSPTQKYRLTARGFNC